MPAISSTHSQDEDESQRGVASPTQNTPGGTSYPNYVDGIMSGYFWTFNDGTRTITYSFHDDEFDVIDAADGSDDQNDWNAYEEGAIVRALDVIDNYINVDFVNTGSRNDDNANFRIRNYNDSWDGWPSSGTFGSFNFPQTDQIDGQFNREGTGWDENGGRGLENGGYGFTTILHEVGHGLGLQHPHADPDVNDFGFSNYPALGLGPYDDGLFTVMSYNDQFQSWNSGSTSNPNWMGFGQAGTLMAADIAALQRLYGARSFVNHGDTVYALPTGNTVGCYYSCIYDTGGTDTITAFGQATAVTIDLRPGAYVSRVTGVYGGFTLAFDPVAGITNASIVDAWIENAVGGQGADVIVGNQRSNDLRGAQGADTIWGDNDGQGPNFGVTLSTSGDDTIYGGSGADLIHGQGGNDTLVGEEDSDTIYGGGGADVIYGDRNDGGAVAASTNVLYGYDIGGPAADDGADTIYGGIGNDVIKGGADADSLRGAAGDDLIYGFTDAASAVVDGNDTIDGGAGSDTIYGAAGADLLMAGDGKDTLDGGVGDDTLYGGAVEAGQENTRDDYLVGFDGADVVYGGDGKDEIYGDGAASGPASSAPGNDFLDGEAGDDTIAGGAGLDTIEGGTGADSLKGDEGADTIYGEDGFDTISGGSDNDSLSGGAGNDRLDGEVGNDTIYGGADADFINGGPAATLGVADVDSLYGEAGDDSIYGGADGDFIDGGQDKDLLDGGAGADTIFGGGGDVTEADVLLGQAGNDSLDGGGGADLLMGGTENDTLIGNAGFDTLNGENGDDSLDGGDGGDTLNGGAGNDVYILRGHEVIEETGAGATGGNDTIEAYVGFTASASFDNIEVFELMVASATVAYGNALDNKIFGNAGNDFLVGLGGADSIVGDAGRDTLDGGVGVDTLNGGAGTDVYLYGAGDVINDSGSETDDRLETSVSASLFDVSGVENVTATGSSGITLTGNDVANVLLGNSGANKLYGNGGADSLDGGSGADTMNGGAGADTMRGGSSNDSMVGGDGANDLADQMFGDAGNDTMRGFDGADSLQGGDGQDKLYGDAHNDTLDGGNDADLLDGGDGDDSLVGGAGSDTLVAAAGRDAVVAGAADSDVLLMDYSLLDTPVGVIGFGGSLAAGYDGAFGYTPNAGSGAYARVDFTGIERFDLRGGTVGDSLRTGDGNDSVAGNGGDDVLETGLGVDDVDGGDGTADFWIADKSFAGSASKIVIDLTIQGGALQSTYLGSGEVRGIERLNLKTGAGADVITTLAARLDDVLDTGAGGDTVKVAGGRDSVAMGAGSDLLIVDYSAITTYDLTMVGFSGTLAAGYGGFFGYAPNAGSGAYDRIDFSGVERFDITSGAGNDYVQTGDGADVARGMAGNDHLNTGAGADTIDGGANEAGQADRWEANKSAATTAIVLDLNATGVQSTYTIGSVSATVRGIEALGYDGDRRFVTGSADDVITTRAQFFTDTIATGLGDDTVKVAGGRDLVDMGGGSNDTLVIDYGALTFALTMVGFGGDLANGYGAYFGYSPNPGSGVYDRVDFAGVERFDVTGGIEGDYVQTGDGSDIVRGMAGNDHLNTGKGADTIDGGANDPTSGDRWEADKSDATTAIVLDLTSTGIQSTYAINGVTATVRGIEALGYDGDRRFVTGSGDDVITTRAQFFTDTLSTGLGNDTVKVAGGRDTVDLGGGSGDTLVIDYTPINFALTMVGFSGDLANGYSAYFGYSPNPGSGAYDRVDFTGVERFDVTAGTQGDYVQTGDGADIVRGMDGDDHLNTGAGADTIDGGTGGADRWEANKSAATTAIILDLTATGVQATYSIGGIKSTVQGVEALGYDDARRFVTGSGSDVITTRDDFFNDTIATGLGNDTVKIAGGRDLVAMGGGTDTLVVNWATHTTPYSTLSFGADALGGYAGAIGYSPNAGSGAYHRVDFSSVERFSITTGSGDDYIQTGDFADTVKGGDGNDALVTGQGIDIIDGGAGAADLWNADKSFATASQNITLNLTLTGVQSTYLGTGTVRGIERLNLKTGAGADVITTLSSFLDDTVDTGAGNDVLKVAGGRDVATMGAGDDLLIIDYSAVAGYGFTTTSFAGALAGGYGGYFAYSPNPGSGAYARIDFSGVERFDISGGTEGDYVQTGDGADYVRGGDGDDFLVTAGGADTVEGGVGVDRWEADKSAATTAIVVNLTSSLTQSYTIGGVAGRFSRIEALGYDGDRRFVTGSGDDVITTRSEFLTDTISTGAGADTVKVAGGRDLVDMGAGANDLLIINYSTLTYPLSTLSFAGDLANGYSGAFGYSPNPGSGAYARVDFTGVERFDVTGGTEGDYVQTGDGRDYVRGLAGDDFLNTGGGSDTIDGGAGGADRWEANKAAATTAIKLDLTLTGVQSTYAVGGAISTVRGIEALGLDDGRRFVTGSGSDVITTRADFLADTLSTGAGNDVVTVAGGRDLVAMGSGTDTLIVNWSNWGDAISTLGFGVDPAGGYSGAYGYAPNAGSGAYGRVDFTGVEKLNLTGGANNDSFVTGNGADTLNGGAGADTMVGGAGNDVYYVDNAGDVVTEASGGGTDVVNSSVTFSLAGQFAENLTLTGVDDINATGNSLANALTGNAGENILNGGIGVDTMRGGAGDDVYYVDNAGDQVIEAAGAAAGHDLVNSSVTFTLSGQNADDLVLTGSGVIDGEGNSLANAITGNSKANVLNGGAGGDTLTGGGGADTFVFANTISASNVDHIADFVAGTDKIMIDRSYFTGLTVGATLDPNAFKDTSIGAVDADDRIIYDRLTGNLFYDADGSGSSAARLFAILDTRPGLTAADITVVA